MTRPTNPLSKLRPQDVERLLLTGSDELLGVVLELNGDPCYRNGLNAVELVAYIIDQRRCSARPTHQERPDPANDRFSSASSGHVGSTLNSHPVMAQFRGATWKG